MNSINFVTNYEVNGIKVKRSQQISYGYTVSNEAGVQIRIVWLQTPLEHLTVLDRNRTFIIIYESDFLPRKPKSLQDKIIRSSKEVQ
jgi:hypothetical protein